MHDGDAMEAVTFRKMPSGPFSDQVRLLLSNGTSNVKNWAAGQKSSSLSPLGRIRVELVVVANGNSDDHRVQVVIPKPGRITSSAIV